MRLAAAWVLAAAIIASFSFHMLPAQGQSSVASPFDHYTTGFRLDGAHQVVACEGCHSDGMFAGTPTQCVGCHVQGSRVRASFQPPRHILTSRQCESCHRTSSFSPVARVDHLEVFGACLSCHNGVKAMGQKPNHIPTTSDCDGCHRPLAWTPVRFTHTGIVDNCFSCHNNVIVAGKPPTHIPAPDTCEGCHNTTAWR